MSKRWKIIGSGMAMTFPIIVDRTASGEVVLLNCEAQFRKLLVWIDDKRAKRTRSGSYGYIVYGILENGNVNANLCKQNCMWFPDDVNQYFVHIGGFPVIKQMTDATYLNCHLVTGIQFSTVEDNVVRGRVISRYSSTPKKFNLA